MSLYIINIYLSLHYLSPIVIEPSYDYVIKNEKVIYNKTI